MCVVAEVRTVQVERSGIWIARVKTEPEPAKLSLPTNADGTATFGFWSAAANARVRRRSPKFRNPNIVLAISLDDARPLPPHGLFLYPILLRGGFDCDSFPAPHCSV